MRFEMYKPRELDLRPYIFRLVREEKDVPGIEVTIVPDVTSYGFSRFFPDTDYSGFCHKSSFG